MKSKFFTKTSPWMSLNGSLFDSFWQSRVPTPFNLLSFQIFLFFFTVIFTLISAIVKFVLVVQSTLVISNSKGLSKILRDIRTSTYQICRLEEKINRTTAFNKCRCNWTLEVRHMLKILWKRGEIAPLEQFLLFSTIFCYLLLDFHF